MQYPVSISVNINGSDVDSGDGSASENDYASGDQGMNVEKGWFLYNV